MINANTTTSTTSTSINLTTRVYMKTSGDGVEYVRIIAPKELQKLLKKPAVWRSLKTSDKIESLETAAVLSVATLEFMQEAATELLANKTPVVALSDEIKVFGFKEQLVAVDRELVEEMKADLKKSFSQTFTPKNKITNKKKESIETTPVSVRKLKFNHRRKTRKFQQFEQRRTLRPSRDME